MKHTFVELNRPPDDENDEADICDLSDISVKFSTKQYIYIITHRT